MGLPLSSVHPSRLARVIVEVDTPSANAAIFMLSYSLPSTVTATRLGFMAVKPDALACLLLALGRLLHGLPVAGSK